MQFDLQSEPYGALGNITGRGVVRTLGRPDLDLLSVLIRESLQNSLDARRGDSNEIAFSVNAHRLHGTRLRVLREAFADGKGKSYMPLSSLFSSRDLTVLILGDRGTIGLNGPTRADAPSSVTERNFVDFFRNIGEAPEGLGTGGTYGYGKGVLFLASALETILVYTRVAKGRGHESRLMGMTLHGAGHETRTRGRLTGRHWWGERAADDIVDPMTGTPAEELALQLGFEPFGAECGTQVMVLQPRFDEEDLVKAVRSLLEYALLYAWPWTCGLGRASTRLVLCGSVDGTEIAPPRIDEFVGLRELEQAMRQALNTEHSGPSAGGELINIACQRPAVELGSLALRRFFHTGHASMPSVLSDADEPISARHVALIRGARLVVKYQIGPAPASPDVEYVGVFVASDDEDVERAFADAEPPTHDDWAPKFVSERPHQTIVRTAVRRIRDAVESFVAPQHVSASEASGSASGWFVSGLAALLPSAAGERPGPMRGIGAGGARQRSRHLLEFTGEESWEHSGKNAIVNLRYRVRTRPSTARTVVSAEPEVLVGDGTAREAEAPEQAEAVRVLGWISEDSGAYVSNGPELDLAHVSSSFVRLRVVVPPDAMFTVRIVGDA